MNTYKSLLIGAVSVALFQGCGSNSSNSPGVERFSSEVSKTADQMKTAILGADVVPSALRSVEPFVGIGSNWTTNGVVAFDTGTVSMMDWFGDFFNAEYTRSNGSTPTPFGKFNTITSILCAIGESASKDPDTMPTNGPQTLTLTAAIISNCRIIGVPTGTEVSATFSTPGGAIYQKQMEISAPFTNSVLYGKTGTITTVSFREGTTRIIAKFDDTTKSIWLENITVNPGAELSFARIYINGSTGHTTVIGRYGNQTETHNVRFIAKGTVSETPSSDKIALSVIWSGQSIPGNASGTAEACVDPSNGALNPDNSLTCGTHTGTLVSGSAAVLNSVTAFAGFAITNATDLNWNSTNLLTQPLL